MSERMAGRADHGVAVRIEGVSKSFGATAVLHDCSLEVPAGGFVTLLGASGSGKTTLLRIVAGFLNADAGEIFFDGDAMGGVAPHRRNIGMVFQSYALFPHMSVFDNVAYPLRMRGLKDRLGQRVSETLDSVHLGAFADRFPDALSGGQRQRVAMARALVSRPPLVLLDEPLSAPDKELREQLQVEIKSIHRRSGSTFINVTHDQGEALGMSDLVVVMGNGRIQQADRPQDLWNRPANAFVARFLGGSNLLPAEGRGGVYRLGDGTALRAAEGGESGAVELAFRPETASISRAPSGDEGYNELSAKVRETIFHGDSVKVVVVAAGQEMTVRTRPDDVAGIEPDAEIVIRWPVRSTLALAREQDGR